MEIPLVPAQELKAQWQNPKDIFSLLLLVGPDVVQKAIAQLVGVRFRLPKKGPTLYLTPIVFSFGWVAYAFTNLAATLGDHRLMPAPDVDIQVINCENGYVRANNSWILGRLLRDYESRVGEAERTANPPEGSTGKVSMVIDIFVAQSVDDRGPRPSAAWWLSWPFIAAQLLIAAIPWIKWGYWPPFMITACGTILGILTAAMPQWVYEKWPGSRLDVKKAKPIALTRGNGAQYVMLILCYGGSWDIERLASNHLAEHWATKYFSTAVVVLWVLLLLTVTGLQQHTWFLVILGACGSIWQTYIAAKPVSSQNVHIDLQPWAERPTITGYHYHHEVKAKLKEEKWREYTESDAREEYERRISEPDVRGVMGALIELEKCYPRAGASLLPTFFPGGLDYQPKSLGFERERQFWRYAEPEIS